MKTWVKSILVLSSMTVSVASAAFPAAADITDIVQLTPEQTIALYGESVDAQYYTTTNTWSDCTFHYIGTSLGLKSGEYQNISEAGYTSSDIDILFNSYWNFYAVFTNDVPNISTSSPQFLFRFAPSVNISGIAYFRQIVASPRFTNYGSGFDPWRDSYYSACSVSFSPSPEVFYGASSHAPSTDAPADAYFFLNPSFSNLTEILSPNPFAFCDLYLQDLDSTTGKENTFSYSGLVFRPSRSPAVLMSFVNPAGGDYQDTAYLIAMSCPRVTDGYIMPDVVTTASDYSGQLDDIITQGAANNTLLQQILAKLDVIYQRMQQQGYSPTLIPAETIPRSLQQYYSGIATAAPSVSAINAAAGGGALVPFSDILAASGLGQVFGLLVGLCCAGWVLTRGRSG